MGGWYGTGVKDWVFGCSERQAGQAGELDMKRVVVFLVLGVQMGWAGGLEAGGPAFSVQQGPEIFQLSPVSAKRDMLGEAAEYSLGILVEVPRKGLRGSQADLESVIALRKWLEQTKDEVARILALTLQYNVDSAILNEVFRKERKRLGETLETEFAEESFDAELLAGLLKKNEIDEEGSLNYALSLETEIGEFCRKKGYQAGDFLSGEIFEKENDKVEVTVIRKKEIDGQIQSEQVKRDIRDINLLPTIMFGTEPKNKMELLPYILPEILRTIEEARNVRMVAGIYLKDKDFKVEAEDKNNIFNDKLRQEMEQEIAAKKQNRLTSKKRQPIEYQIDQVIGFLRKRVNSQEKEYNVGLYLKFLPYVRNEKIYPKYFPKFARKHNMYGMFLLLCE